jgi:hypothetical protein
MFALGVQQYCEVVVPDRNDGMVFAKGGSISGTAISA